jgi:hypothetical protein
LISKVRVFIWFSHCASSLDHLIRSHQHIWWNRQADLLSRFQIDDELERQVDLLGGFEIHYELELLRLFHGQVSGLRGKQCQT